MAYLAICIMAVIFALPKMLGRIWYSIKYRQALREIESHGNR